MSFINETLNWSDLRLFLVVAQQGGLVGAARQSGVSAPTLSRRMTSLERAVGAPLFERHQSGYDMTSAGKELLQQVEEMAAKAEAINAWRMDLDPRPVVRITAGLWTSSFIARHLAELDPASTGPRIELLTGANFLNLTRREADLGIRNQRPDQQGLARRRIGSVAFAIYGQKAYVEQNPEASSEARFVGCDWIVPLSEGSTGPSSHWLRQRLKHPPRLSCGTAHSVLEASAQGAGLCILPRFVGESDDRLTACSDPIADLTHTQWLISHDESRSQPHIKKVSRALFDLFVRHRPLFA